MGLIEGFHDDDISVLNGLLCYNSLLVPIVKLINISHHNSLLSFSPPPYNIALHTILYMCTVRSTGLFSYQSAASHCTPYRAARATNTRQQI